MEIKGKTIGTGKPLLCVPVMESNKEEIIDELMFSRITKIIMQCAKCLRLRQSA